jgi:hypothetical protein
MTNRLRDGKLNEINKFWTVRYDRDLDSQFVSDGNGGRLLFGTKRAAKEFWRDAKQFSGWPGKVVQVKVSISEISAKS